MDRKELVKQLKEQLERNYVEKRTAVQARDEYNKDEVDKVTYCMCNAMQRRRYAKIFIEHFESTY